MQLSALHVAHAGFLTRQLHFSQFGTVWYGSSSCRPPALPTVKVPGRSESVTWIRDSCRLVGSILCTSEVCSRTQPELDSLDAGGECDQSQTGRRMIGVTFRCFLLAPFAGLAVHLLLCKYFAHQKFAAERSLSLTPWTQVVSPSFCPTLLFSCMLLLLHAIYLTPRDLPNYQTPADLAKMTAF
jgi:hypothetical protein